MLPCFRASVDLYMDVQGGRGAEYLYFLIEISLCKYLRLLDSHSSVASCDIPLVLLLSLQQNCKDRSFGFPLTFVCCFIAAVRKISFPCYILHKVNIPLHNIIIPYSIRPKNLRSSILYIFDIEKS